ncbi:MAG: excinuclease ABC subunit UvrC [Gemmatimonadota bacterium]
MLQVPERITARIPHLPESPGVYLWKDEAGRVLYIGKAKRLRSRVRSYLAPSDEAGPRTLALVRLIRDVETIVVPSEAHALILEANLIKEHRPRFNVALRDDKSYPYIKVTAQEPFPRVVVTRRLIADGARYFGPYTDVGAMRRALNVVKRIFTVRSCTWDLPADAPDRPCLDHHIGRCLAPCVGLQSIEDYRLMIDEVLLFLEGRTAEVIRRVRERMEEASRELGFERAAGLRDVLRHLERMEEPTVVVQVGGGDRDVVGYARDGDDASLVVLRIRGGRLLARDHRLMENVEGEVDEAVLSAFLAGFYAGSEERARELMVPFDFEDREALEVSLGTARVVVPQRGPRREMVDLADENARHLLEEFKLASMEADERASSPVYELQRELGLSRLPRTLVCFDISTAQGTDTVGSCVWFENGRPRRSEYRRFKVRTVEGSDDFASMKEVVGRYFQRRIREGQPLPDLVVVDGGKGQLHAAATAMGEAGAAAIQVVSLAKKEELVFIPGRPEPVRLSRRSGALRTLQQARDEAHRFAVTFNRARRTARTITSELLRIPGVGPAKRRALLQTFGSLDGVRAAGIDDIARVRGFSAGSARRLLSHLGVTVDLPAAPEPSTAPATAGDADDSDGQDA